MTTATDDSTFISTGNPVQDQALRDQAERDGAAGIPITEPVQQDYFGTDDRYKVRLGDGVSWVEFKVLNEGERKNIQNKSASDIRMQRNTGDMFMRNQPGSSRHSLLVAALTDWNLKSRGAPVAFSKRNVEDFLDKANPRVIDDILKEVYKKNPWLMQDMTIEDIDKQIDELQEMRQLKVQEDAGKGV